MASPYLNNLIQIAKEELPQLAHDITNSSTIYTVQDAAKRMLNIVQYLVHHVILSDPSVAAAQAAATKAAAAPALPPPPVGHQYVRGQDGRIYVQQIPPTYAHVPVTAPVGHPPAVEHFPSQTPVVAAPAPSALPAAHFGLPPIVTPGPSPSDVGSPVMEVSITPNGTRVAMPGQPTMVLPPGAPIPAAPGRIPVPGLNAPMVAAVPGVPVGAPGQPAEVIVSDGMSPEVAAAIAGRQGDQPLIDATGGAKNVTNE